MNNDLSNDLTLFPKPKFKCYVILSLSLEQYLLCIQLFSILISSNVKLETNLRKQVIEGSSMYNYHIAPHGWILIIAWKLEVILCHLAQSLNLLQEAGLLVLHLEPFEMFSVSASEERNPTAFWPCSVCAVLFQKSGDKVSDFSGFCGQRVGFLTSEMVTLMSACLLGLKGKYKGP